MENSTLLVIATFIVMFAGALFGLFVFMVRAMRADSREAITGLQSLVTKLLQIEHANDRTFKEFEVLLERRCRHIFSTRVPRGLDNSSQTDPEDVDLEQGMRERRDFASQTLPIVVITPPSSLPPLLVRPALSSDVVIPI